MEILLLNIFLILIEGVFVNNNKKSNRKRYCVIVFIQLFITHAFINPYSVVDLPGYIHAFELFGSNTIERSYIIGYNGIKMEFGWILLNKLLYLISHNYIILLIFTSLIIVGSYSVTIYNYSPIAWFSAFIFICSLYCQSLFVLRQYCAMSLCLLSLPYIVKREIIKFVILYAIAALLHKTAVIFGLVYVLYNIRLDRKFWMISLVVTIIISGISTTIFNWLFANTWYNAYSEMEGSNYTAFFISCCVLILYLYSIKWDTIKPTSYEKCFLIMEIIAICLSFIGTGFSPTNRLVKYFTMSSVFLIPIGINRIKSVSLKTLISIAIIIMYLLLFFAPSNVNYIKDYSLNF